MGINKLITQKVLLPLAESPETRPLVPMVMAAHSKATKQTAIALVLWWVVAVPCIAALAFWLPSHADPTWADDSGYLLFGFISIGSWLPLLAGIVLMIVASVQVRSWLVRWQVTKCLDGNSTHCAPENIAPIRAAVAIGKPEVAFRVSGIVLLALLIGGGLLWAAAFYLAVQSVVGMAASSPKFL
ncbi:MAG: hypothetical protein FWD63_05015 [Propionibacteriaceae bacterium]|nr:hypothetical protein [Propionibacteriaceae bacterium]